MNEVTIGRIVEFHPNGNETNKLPNGMQTSAAIVTQICGSYVNLSLITADPSGNNVKQVWSVAHKSEAEKVAGLSYWDWLPRV